MRENTCNIMYALFGLSFFSGWIYLIHDSPHPPKLGNSENDPRESWKILKVNYAFTILEKNRIGTI